MININRDYFNNIEVPDYVLCKANRERIGVLNCTEKTLDVKFNDINEISFKINLYIDENTKNPYYEAVEVMKYILLPDIGFFCISSVDIESEGTKEESKTVAGKESQCLFAQKYLEVFAINTGDESANNEVQFYNMIDKSKSLLHLILEKFPDWTIGHVDPALVSQQRTFEEITRQDVYSFLSTDVAKAFQCVFIFNTLNNTINAYEEKTLGLDTDLHISYNNLLKNTSVSCSTDDIKTCLTLYGKDDMNVRTVNMGFDRIYNFDYYNSTDFWSKELYEAYNKWIELRNSKLEEYNSLLSEYNQYQAEIDYLTYEMMPDKTENQNDWTKYGLHPLQEQMKIYQQKQNLSKNAGHGEPASEYYLSEYIPIYNTINALSLLIYQRQNQINLLQIPQNEIGKQMDDITSLVSMENYFTANQLKELYPFIREDEVSTDNFAITSIMSINEKYEQYHGLLEYGEKELAKVSIPQLTFKSDMVNLFAIPEFSDFTGNFDVGNYIWVSLRDDYSVKARLLSVHINFCDVTDFSVEFGNVTRKAKNVYTDITDAIKTAQSAAASVSFNSSNWNKANKTSAAIDQMLADGLLNAGVRLQSANSEIEIDSRGIFVNTTREGYINDAIYIGDSQILFTQDNWRTVEEAIGRVDINGESVFGVIAKAVLAGHIIGSTVTGGIIEGNEIYGNTITVGGKQNEKGAFIVLDENGEEAGRWDCNGIVLPTNASISWDNITGTDNVAYTSDIPTRTSQLTNDSDYKTGIQVTQITKDTVTTSYVNALKITADSVACENLTGNRITGKRFVGVDEDGFEFLGINCDRNDGWAIYAGVPLKGAVEPYADQRIFNIGHNGEMYAERGMFRNLRIEDRCAGNGNSDVITGIDFIYSKGSSDPIHIGTIYQDASAFRLNSDNNIELNATKNDDSTVSIYGQTITLGGTVNAEYNIRHKGSADFYYEDSESNSHHYGALLADEWGMVIKSPDGEINFYAPDNGDGRCIFHLEVEMHNTVYDESGSSVISSDRNLKHSIEPLNIEKSSEFVYSLTPCKFKYNAGTSDRYHHGFIAQDVKESMETFTGEDWGLYVEYHSNGELRRGLRNEELIADLIAAIQTQNERIKVLEEKMNRN